jgi:hypothetical protein
MLWRISAWQSKVVAVSAALTRDRVCGSALRLPVHSLFYEHARVLDGFAALTAERGGG